LKPFDIASGIHTPAVPISFYLQQSLFLIIPLEQTRFELGMEQLKQIDGAGGENHRSLYPIAKKVFVQRKIKIFGTGTF